MKRICKNILLSLLIVVITFTGIPSVGVLAQEASKSATQPTTTTPEQNSTSADVGQQPQASTSGDSLPAPTVTPPPITRVPTEENDNLFAGKKASDLLSLDFDEPIITSAEVKQPVRIRTLDKKDYTVTESVTITIDNATRDSIDLILFDTNDAEIDIPIVLTEDVEAIRAHIQPPANVKPGKYVLQVTDADDQVAEVSFTWGVLSFNTDKTMYRTGEKVNIFMGVTDEQGNIDCDANVSVTITDPEKKVATLSTEDDTVSVNTACKEHGPSQQADYETGFLPVVPGQYNLTMKAVTSQDTYTMTEQLSVQTEDLPYSIRRSMPTRIFPIDPFAVTLEITAKQDFTGTIRDIAPGDFVLTPSTSSASLEQITNRVSSASAQRRGFSGYPIGQLRIPFEGEHPMSLDFGGTIQDPLLKDLYKNFGLLGHDGLDFAMPIGTPILSTDAGTVLWAGPGDYGETVIIEHAWGRSYYGHLSKIDVTDGQVVGKGVQIGLSGNTGISTGPHLHFGIKPTTNDMHNGYFGKIDPLPFLTLSDNSQILSGKTSGDFQSVKIISWDVSLKKDEKVTLVYTMKAPETHPAVHLIGPVQFVTKNEDGTQETIVQSDTKLWQVVADQAPVLGAQISKDQTTISHFPMQSIDPALFNVPEGYPLRLASFGTEIKGTMNATRVDKEQVLTTFIVKDEAGNSHAANFTLQNAIPHETSKTNYTLHRKDIFPNVDMDYTTHDGYLQQVLTVKSDQARREFAFAMNLSNDMVLEDIDKSSGHAIIKHKTTGEELMTLRYPQGIDAKNQRIDYKYRVENNQLVLYPNRVWQYDQAVFPIKIYAPINTIAWSEVAISVGDTCIDGEACARDGDISMIQPAGYHWGLEVLKKHVVVKVDKMNKEAREEQSEPTISRKDLIRLSDKNEKIVDQIPKKMSKRLDAYENMARYGIDYTQLATQQQLAEIRNKEKNGYAPVLDARKKKNLLKKKSKLTASVIASERKLAYKPEPRPNVFARLLKRIIKPASAATTVTSSIGSAGGRTYSTIYGAGATSWEDSKDGNLVSLDQVQVGETYNDSTFSITTGIRIGGSTTDSTHYMHLTVASSDRHDGTEGSGVHIFCNGNNTGVTLEDNYDRVEWVEITNCNSADGGAGVSSDDAITNTLIQYVIIHGFSAPTFSVSGIKFPSGSASCSTTIRNTIIYDGDANGLNGNGSTTCTMTAENVTLYGMSGRGYHEDGATMNIKNCIGMSTTTEDIVVVNGTVTYCMSEDASADDIGGTGNKINQSTSGQFISTTDDFHLVSTSTAIDAGNSGVGTTTDIDNDTREGTFDMGADEFPNPPLYKLMRHGKYFGSNGERAFTF